VLVAPCAAAMRRLLSICDDFASDYSISFNAAKSKCMVISPYTRRNVQYCEFVVQGKPMEFVSSYVHLGHLITYNWITTAIFLKDDVTLLARSIMFYAIFKGFVLLLSISCFSLTVLVSMNVSFGSWRAIR